MVYGACLHPHLGTGMCSEGTPECVAVESARLPPSRPAFRGCHGCQRMGRAAQPSLRAGPLPHQRLPPPLPARPACRPLLKCPPSFHMRVGRHPECEHAQLPFVGILLAFRACSIAGEDLQTQEACDSPPALPCCKSCGRAAERQTYEMWEGAVATSLSDLSHPPALPPHPIESRL